MHIEIQTKNTEVVTWFSGHTWSPRPFGEYFFGPDPNTELLGYFSEIHVNTGGRPFRRWMVRHALDETEKLADYGKGVFFIQDDEERVHPFQFWGVRHELRAECGFPLSSLTGDKECALSIGGEKWSGLSVSDARYFMTPELLIYLGEEAHDVIKALCLVSSYEVQITIPREEQLNGNLF
ncbi:hypothetical protein [Acanthopleuribacter pedis]|uniref:Uncharacterized protein n=1 Tax=Acanthopleuribacter pedis TaxID=442870 RepID=A0A8J7QGZ3_9BACT|nr:hypothetical protein [Acanthopleuribacter pedis]MBO1318415.1 hypothetical protein [Acanthopleuribacter pedis]